MFIACTERLRTINTYTSVRCEILGGAAHARMLRERKHVRLLLLGVCLFKSESGLRGEKMSLVKSTRWPMNPTCGLGQGLLERVIQKPFLWGRSNRLLRHDTPSLSDGPLSTLVSCLP
ncbi:hypothetical protein AVEN_113115-1 [Araneus ventricosus]|uniref:Uncharacterized protein n=1 Tax=Araneus ventricosus TaxID=182803 RepID=A0A4Y2P3Z4_ARAVE|nr:hypothetical protein AVEN_113115-1 [Araneus ventricosus]